MKKRKRTKKEKMHVPALLCIVREEKKGRKKEIFRNEKKGICFGGGDKNLEKEVGLQYM
jgi:hypothetical protein